MKKGFIIIFLILILGFLSFNKTSVQASANEYRQFTSITPSKGKLLIDYTDAEMAPYVKATKKRRFAGWRISYISKHVKCSFISETVLSIYNTGTTPIKYTITQVNSSVYKTSISSTGSIKYSIKGDIKKFKNELSTELKIENTESSTVEIKTTENLEINVDPKTKAVMYLEGTGYLTNGYARFYDFWICTEKGGFEFFQITDIYPKIVKVAL